MKFTNHLRSLKSLGFDQQAKSINAVASANVVQPAEVAPASRKTVRHNRATSTSCATLLAVILAILLTSAVRAQGTGFTYQGNLNVSGSPANGTYDFQFQVFDALTAGAQQGPTLTRTGVTVSSGRFSVELDFGNVFPGAMRFMAIGVKLPADPSYTPQSPRIKFASTPYAIRSLSAGTADNATQLNGVAAGQYVMTTDPRLSDARTPSAGSGNYIQNSTVQQASSNFNISGNGTAAGTLTGNIVSATTQFNIGANRVLSNPGSDNLFAGVSAGAVTTGGFNSFFGAKAGRLNGTGVSNSFFGTEAGDKNTSGNGNSFFGDRSGFSNTTGERNSFFGALAGTSTTQGRRNSFFGYASGTSNIGTSVTDPNTSIVYLRGTDNSFMGFEAGKFNTSGVENAFFGKWAGHTNTGNISFPDVGCEFDCGPFYSGGRNSFFGVEAGYLTNGNTGSAASNNAFFGYRAGYANTTGFSNTYIGANAGGSATIIGATAIGADTNVACSGCTVIGTSSSSSSNRVGIGTNNPAHRMEIVASGAGLGTLHLRNTNERVVIGLQSTIGGVGQTWTIENGVFGTQGLFAIYNSNTGATGLSIRPVTNNVGIGTDNPSTKLQVIGTATVTALVQTSDRRYKQGIQQLSQALGKLSQLRGVSYEWKRSEYPKMNFDAGRQIGLLAQEVEQVFPEAVKKDSDGMYSVSYLTLIPVVIEAIKEQQQQYQMVEAASAAKDKQLEQLRQENAALRRRLEAVEKALEKIIK